ncbi:MAG: type VI secretion system ATPase TssH, partial [Desulfovibrio sp.]|nr:type VI secretion system ATPase TssH [Desulfovibrio sp.]
MDMRQFTEKSRQALGAAQDIAARLGHQQVDVEHLALALARQEGGLVPRLLEKMEIRTGAYEQALEQDLRKKPSVSGSGSGELSLAPRLHRLLLRAQDTARGMKDEFVSVEHIFLEMTTEGGGTVIGKVNGIFGITKDKLLQAMSAVRGNQR